MPTRNEEKDHGKYLPAQGRYEAAAKTLKAINFRVTRFGELLLKGGNTYSASLW